MKKITIDPITRLEGHGKIEIFLNDEGDVENCYFQIPELRGFERFCIGRPVEELPRTVCKICGVCPVDHHLASAKAVDAVYNVEPPPAAKKLRELYKAAHTIHSHVAHFYALAAPDFVLGPDAPAAERNVLGLVKKVGLEIGGQVLAIRKAAQRVQTLIGGACTHTVFCVPGGISKPLSKEEHEEILKLSANFVEFAKFSLKLFDDVVLKNKAYVDLILSDPYQLRIHNIGLVDENNKVNFYDGKPRIVDVNGKEIAKYEPKDYYKHIGEHVEPYSYLKYPYLLAKGWKGFVEGEDSGVYRAAPLARLNAADGMATPLAQAEYEKFFSTLKKPVNSTLAYHWARLIELMYACELTVKLANDPEILNPKVRNLPTEKPTEGVGIVEASRGLLTHHYKTDEKGIVTSINLIVGTTNNNAAITMSIKKAAMGLIKKGKVVSDGILNMIEMAFRAYDPCFSCATHSLPGKMPLIVNIKNKNGEIIQTLKRD